jgi:hypothetical protein
MKHYTSDNVLAVVDFDKMFMYVLVGWEGSTFLLTTCLGLMGWKSLMVSSSYEMLDMHAGLEFYHPLGKQGTIWTNLVQGNDHKMPKTFLIPDTLALESPLRGHFLLSRIGSRLLTRNRSTLKSPILRWFLLATFFTAGSLHGAKMTTSQKPLCLVKLRPVMSWSKAIVVGILHRCTIDNA